MSLQIDSDTCNKTADDISKSAYPNACWNTVETEATLVLKLFNTISPCTYLRYGDGEMNLIENHPAFAKKLIASAGACSVIGLPGNYTKTQHSWRTVLLKQFSRGGVTIGGPIVSAVLPLYKPSIISSAIKNKKAVWITNNSKIIKRNLTDHSFCSFFGFDERSSDAFIQIPPGRTLPYTSDIFGVYDRIFKEISTLGNFDVAIIGAGAMGKILGHRIASQLNKSVLDAGCILSAMRGYKTDRLVLQNQLKGLVWDGPSTKSG